MSSSPGWNRSAAAFPGGERRDQRRHSMPRHAGYGPISQARCGFGMTEVGNGRDEAMSRGTPVVSAGKEDEDGSND